MELSFDKIKKLAEMASNYVVVTQFINGCLSVLYYSEGIPALCGYTNEEMSKADLSNALNFSFENIHDATSLREKVLGIISNDTTCEYNVGLKNKNGTIVSLEGTAMSLGKYNGYPTIMFVVDEKSTKNLNQTALLLQNNEQKYRNIVEFAEIICFDYDIRKHTVTMDRKLLEKLGISSNLTNMPYDFINLGIISSESEAAFISVYDRIQKGVNDITYEDWFNFPGYNQPVFLKTKYKIDFDENNLPIMAHGIGVDVTEQKNAEIEHKNRTLAILRMNPNSLAALSFNVTQNECTSFRSSDERFSEIIKSKTLDEFLASVLTLIPNKEERIRYINRISRGSLLAAFKNGVFQISNECKMLTSRDNYLQFVKTQIDLVSNPVSGDIEAIIHMQSIQSDKLKDSLLSGTVEREFEFIALLHMPSGFYTIIRKNDKTGAVELSNFNESFKKNLFEMVAHKDRQTVFDRINLDYINDELNRSERIVIEFDTDDDASTSRRINITISYLNASKETALITCKDITDYYNEVNERNKELFQALEREKEANLAKSQFLSLVSHDIRTPLNGIIGMNELAMKEEISDSARNYLLKAKAASEFLLGLMNDLLDLSRIDLGKIKLYPEKYTPSEFNGYLKAVINPLCEKKNISFDIIVKNELKDIYVDKLRFNQILFNLLSNSVKYTPAGGFLRLTVEQEQIDSKNAKSRYTIEDNGIGMSKEFQKHLFESFKQENREKQYSNIGAGLGLSIVKSLIDLMGGSIFVESEINKGTKFVIEISHFVTGKDCDSSKTDTNVYTKEIKLSGKNILLCEDNEINQEIATELLKAQGINVTIANDGQEGVDIFSATNEGNFDAILMDIRMPVMDGLTATRTIRSLDRNDAKSIPIIALTANALNEEKDECIKAGMNDFLSKPFDVEKLYQKLNDAING